MIIMPDDGERREAKRSNESVDEGCSNVHRQVTPLTYRVKDAEESTDARHRDPSKDVPIISRDLDRQRHGGAPTETVKPQQRYSLGRNREDQYVQSPRDASCRGPLRGDGAIGDGGNVENVLSALVSLPGWNSFAKAGGSAGASLDMGIPAFQSPQLTTRVLQSPQVSTRESFIIPSGITTEPVHFVPDGSSVNSEATQMTRATLPSSRLSQRNSGHFSSIERLVTPRIPQSLQTALHSDDVAVACTPQRQDRRSHSVVPVPISPMLVPRSSSPVMQKRTVVPSAFNSHGAPFLTTTYGRIESPVVPRRSVAGASITDLAEGSSLIWRPEPALTSTKKAIMAAGGSTDNSDAVVLGSPRRIFNPGWDSAECHATPIQGSPNGRDYLGATMDTSAFTPERILDRSGHQNVRRDSSVLFLSPREPQEAKLRPQAIPQQYSMPAPLFHVHHSVSNLPSVSNSMRSTLSLPAACQNMESYGMLPRGGADLCRTRMTTKPVRTCMPAAMAKRTVKESPVQFNRTVMASPLLSSRRTMVHQAVFTPAVHTRSHVDTISASTRNPSGPRGFLDDECVWTDSAVREI